MKEGSKRQGHPGHIPRRTVSSRAVRSLSRSSTALATQPLDITDQDLYVKAFCSAFPNPHRYL